MSDRIPPFCLPNTNGGGASKHRDGAAEPRSHQNHRSSRRGERVSKLRAAYVCVGLVIAAVWVGHPGEPMWKDLVRTAALMVVVASVVSLRRRRHTTTDDVVRAQRLSVPRLLAAKLGLLVAAVAAQLFLQRYTSHADAWVGAGLGVMVAVAGPRLHQTFMMRGGEVGDAGGR
jgi:hypothetical protein